MGATSKGKRKIHVNGRDFYWTPRIHNDYLTTYLTIMTPDKKFFARYQVIRRNEETINNTFVGNILIDQAEITELLHVESGLRMLSPAWTNVYESAYTPAVVRKVILYIFETLK